MQQLEPGHRGHAQPCCSSWEGRLDDKPSPPLPSKRAGGRLADGFSTPKPLGSQSAEGHELRALLSQRSGAGAPCIPNGEKMESQQPEGFLYSSTARTMQVLAAPTIVVLCRSSAGTRVSEMTDRAGEYEVTPHADRLAPRPSALQRILRTIDLPSNVLLGSRNVVTPDGE